MRADIGGLNTARILTKVARVPSILLDNTASLVINGRNRRWGFGNLLPSGANFPSKKSARDRL
mgnify:CR=1 FL=1